MDIDKAKTDLRSVIDLLDFYKNKMEYLLYENERLKEEKLIFLSILNLINGVLVIEDSYKY